MTTIEFRLDICPRAQGRARAVSRGGHARVVKATQDRGNEQTIAALAAAHRPAEVLTGPLEVLVFAVLPRPKVLSRVSAKTGKPLADPSRRWHTGKPDSDNLAKAMLDALKGWWLDDAQVCLLVVRKEVAAFGELPHWDVQVRTLDDNAAQRQGE